MNELEAIVALSSLPHLGAVKIRLLIQCFGSARQALEADTHAIADLPGFGSLIVEMWKTRHKRVDWQRDIELVHRLNTQIIPFTSPDFPKRLLDIPDHPVLLYIKGNLKAADHQGFAIVGTRHASVYGLEMAERFGSDFAVQGVTVVSGLARGIDTAAHRGALKGGRTLAVIGSGLADIYPQENIALSRQIAENGALISEFPMATPPDRQNFPQRNRIVSGMTIGTILIEAPAKSGAMITMEKGLAQGRRLFALPGRADSENFRGNHLLIKQGEASLVENAYDVLDGFNDLFARQSKKMPSVAMGPLLEKEEEELLRQLPVEEISLEAIEQKTKLPIRNLNILLMSLILKRVIKEYPGKIYKKIMPAGRGEEKR